MNDRSTRGSICLESVSRSGGFDDATIETDDMLGREFAEQFLKDISLGCSEGGPPMLMDIFMNIDLEFLLERNVGVDEGLVEGGRGKFADEAFTGTAHTDDDDRRCRFAIGGPTSRGVCSRVGELDAFDVKTDLEEG